MKFLVFMAFLAIAGISAAQSDIDVVYLKNGSRYTCEIQKIQHDTVFFTQFQGKHLKTYAFPTDEVTLYMVNNFYSTPGEELAKVSRKLIFGTTFVAVGGVLAAVAYRDSRDNLFDMGVGIAALGTIFYISGFNNMRKVGKKIDKLNLQGNRLIFKL